MCTSQILWQDTSPHESTHQKSSGLPPRPASNHKRPLIHRLRASLDDDTACHVGLDASSLSCVALQLRHDWTHLAHTQHTLTSSTLKTPLPFTNLPSHTSITCLLVHHRTDTPSHSHTLTVHSHTIAPPQSQSPPSHNRTLTPSHPHTVHHHTIASSQSHSPPSHNRTPTVTPSHPNSPLSHNHTLTITQSTITQSHPHSHTLTPSHNRTPTVTQSTITP